MWLLLWGEQIARGNTLVQAGDCRPQCLRQLLTTATERATESAAVAASVTEAKFSLRSPSSSRAGMCHVGSTNTHTLTLTLLQCNNTPFRMLRQERAKVWTSTIVYPLACDYDLGGGVLAVQFEFWFCCSAGTGNAYTQHTMATVLLNDPSFSLYFFPPSSPSDSWQCCMAALRLRPQSLYTRFSADVVQLSHQWLLFGLPAKGNFTLCEAERRWKWERGRKKWKKQRLSLVCWPTAQDWQSEWVSESPEPEYSVGQQPAHMFGAWACEQLCSTP